MSSLTPSSTITAAQPANPNGYAWGEPLFANTNEGGGQGTSYPAIYENGSDRYSVMSKTTGYDGINQYTATFTARVFKNSTDPWAEQDSGNAPTTLNSYRNPATEFFPIWNEGHAVVQVGSVLYVFFFIAGQTAANTFLAVKPFDMATDTWGAQITSAIPQFDTPPNDGLNSKGTALCAALDQTTEKIFVVASACSIIGTDTFTALRFGYAAFDTGANSWLNSAFVRMGHDNTVIADECVSTIACDCNGTLMTLFESENYDTGNNTFFYQAVAPDGTLGTIQSTGIVETTSSRHGTVSRLLLTPTEMVLVYGDKWDGLSSFLEINTARAPLPAIGILPTWTLAPVLDITGLTGTPGFNCWMPFYIPTDGLVIVYAWTWLSNVQSKLSMLHWNGTTWDDDFSPTGSVPLALTNGATVTEDANITYDFTAPITLVGSPAELGTNQQIIYSLLSNTLRSCSTPPPPGTCQIIVSGAPPPPFCIVPPVPVGQSTAVAYTEPTELEGS